MSPRRDSNPHGDDPRWRAVVSRDPQASAAFLYAVTTTGVYCRPSCGARTPRPEHVEFFQTTVEAERAGYRPCKRCKPEGPPLAELQAANVAAMCRTLEHAEHPIALADLARGVGLSAFHAHRLFKAATGTTPRAYAQACRAQRLHGGLREASTVTEAVYAAGYGSQSRFYAEATRLLGTSPSEYRKGGPSREIHASIHPCDLGLVLVAVTSAGVCAVLLGDDPDALREELSQRFPRARILSSAPADRQLVRAVLDLVEHPQKAADLPLDIQGTAFQHRVWNALREIPPGTTRTYAEVAAALGSPRGARAVAAACAANPIAVVIPCHRVVGVGGRLAGYRWGLQRKETLLERESSATPRGRSRPR